MGQAGWELCFQFYYSINRQHSEDDSKINNTDIVIFNFWSEIDLESLAWKKTGSLFKEN